MGCKPNSNVPELPYTVPLHSYSTDTNMYSPEPRLNITTCYHSKNSSSLSMQGLCSMQAAGSQCPGALHTGISRHLHLGTDTPAVSEITISSATIPVLSTYLLLLFLSETYNTQNISGSRLCKKSKVTLSEPHDLDSIKALLLPTVQNLQL